jgi:putative transposase
VHHRAGHLFQNRFKNILVEEDPYLLELLRYIHLNPVRSTLPVTLDSLDHYPWTGHAVLLGHHEFPAQDADCVLRQFGATVGGARRAYQQFVCAGAQQGPQRDLDGGGLRRSAGGWQVFPMLARGRERWACDERILGSSDFVDAVRRQIDDQPTRPTCASSAALDALCARTAARFGVERSEIGGASLRRDVLAARAVISHLAVRHHGMSLSAVGRHLALSKQSIARALERAAFVYRERGCTPADFLDG